MTVTGAPHGIVVSSTGVVYVTLLYENAIARFSADAPTSPLAPLTFATLPEDVVFNHAGTKAYAPSVEDRLVYVIDVAAGTKTFIPIQFFPSRIAISRDDARVFVLSPAFESRVYSVPLDGSAGTFVQIPGTAHSITVSPTTGDVYVGLNSGVRRLDPGSLAIKASASGFSVPDDVIAVSPDGSRVWVGNDLGYLQVLDATSLASVGTVSAGAGISALALSPDGAQLYATTHSSELLIVDVAQMTIVKRITLGGSAAHIAFDPTGKTAFVANENEWVDVIK